MAPAGRQRRSESLRAAIVALRYYHAKSALTIFGVAIGVGAIVAIFALLQGLSSSITADFDVLGSNSLTVRSKTTFAEQMQGKVNRLSIQDYDRLKRDLDGVASMTPVFSLFGLFGTTVRAGIRAATGAADTLALIKPPVPSGANPDPIRHRHEYHGLGAPA